MLRASRKYELNEFFRDTVALIRPYLMTKYGLVHRDPVSIREAKERQREVKGYWQIKAWKDSPRIVTVKILTDASWLDTLRKEQERLTLAARLDPSDEIVVRRAVSGLIQFEIPKPQHLCWKICSPELPLDRTAGFKVPLGIALDGSFFYHDFSDPTSTHTFVVGMTGSGKTVLMRMILGALAQQNSPDKFRLILGDSGKKGFNFADFGRVRHLLNPVLTTDEEVSSGLQFMANEISRRATFLRSAVDAMPCYMIAIDEIQSLFSNHPTSIEYAHQIVSMGREFGVFGFFGTQYPNEKQLGNGIKVVKNMRRIAGKTDSVATSYQASGVADANLHTLRGSGDFLALDASGNHRRFQSAIPTPSLLKSLPSTFSPERLLFPELAAEEEVKQSGRKSFVVTMPMIADAIVDERYESLMQNHGISPASAKKVRNTKDELLQELDTRGVKVALPEKDE